METWEAVEKMIDFYHGNIHDIEHFLKVYALARTIGKGEGLELSELKTLELAAIVHDIACPVCREKYGNTNEKYQEAESEPLVREFFSGTDTPPEMVERIVSLVSRHHTYTNVDGDDCRILLEADFLVNAGEKSLPPASVSSAREKIFETKTGKRLLLLLFP